MEIMKRHKTIRLRTFFLQYLFLFCIGTLVLLALLIGLFSLGLSYGAILPANYAENQIAAVKESIASSAEVTPDMIPDTVKYAVFSSGGNFVSGNLTVEDANHAWMSIQDGEKSNIPHSYFVIQRENQVCILRYSLVPQFNSSFLRNYLPNPQILGILVFILSFLIQAAVLTSRFVKKLAQEMTGLQEATTKIQNQDLEFTIQPCGIREIDDVLASLERMKEELKASLKQQWEMEQSRREQISALAHDIKTPLTIIRGNAELLYDTAQDDAQREYNEYILKNAARIEKYTKELIDLSKLQSRIIQEVTRVETDKLLTELEEQMRALASQKSLQVFIQKEKFPEFIMIDRNLFLRAVLNVITNAAEHTPPNGSITLLVRSMQNNVCFTVTDSGCGFSPTDSKEATKQFYMGNQSRGGGNHHGMGLYIAESIIRNHGGTLTLENVKPSGGGKVTMTIPIHP